MLLGWLRHGGAAIAFGDDGGKGKSEHAKKRSKKECCSPTEYVVKSRFAHTVAVWSLGVHRRWKA